MNISKCRSAHIKHTSHTKERNVSIYIFATYGQFVLVYNRFKKGISNSESGPSDIRPDIWYPADISNSVSLK